MKVTFLPRLALLAAAFMAFTSVLRADRYDHSGRAGDFADGKWLNQTTSPPGGPNIYGNPGSGDDAYFFGSTITASGGNVRLLSGDNLQLSGTLTAVNVGLLNSLSGAGTLDVQAIVQDAFGFGPVVSIDGGHLKAQNGDGVAGVTAGGTVTDATCSGTNGCGGYDGGSSLTITGLGSSGQADFFNASTLTASGGLQDFFLNFQSGSTGNVSTINNGSATVDGTGSSLIVAGDFLTNSQSLTVTAGGAATVNGKLTQNNGAPFSITGSGSTLTVGQDFSLTGGSIQISTGGAVTVGTLTQNRGSDSLDGGNSTLTVDQDFSLMAGFLDISAGGALNVNGRLSLDGGQDAGGNVVGGGGNWSSGAMINTTGTIFVGVRTGSFSLGISSGTVVRSGFAEIGSETGGRGTVSLSDANTLWEVQSGGMAIGQDGSGTFNLSAGARLLLDTGANLAIGLSAGSNGRLTSDNATVEARGLVAIGEDAGSVGSVFLTNSARLLAGPQDFTVGDSGQGNLSVFSGSQVTVSGATTNFIVGNRAGSSGSLSMGNANSSVILAGSATVASEASARGFVNISAGGNWKINGSLTVGSGGAGNVSIAGASATCFIGGGVANSVHKIGTAGGTGRVAISAGGALSATGDSFTLGDDIGGNGTISVTDANSTFLVGTVFPMTVGFNGLGSVTVAGGANAVVRPSGVEVAVKSGSQGSILITDPGSLFETNSIIFGDRAIPGFPAPAAPARSRCRTQDSCAWTPRLTLAAAPRIRA